jgi:prepilin peptidase CpaA
VDSTIFAFAVLFGLLAAAVCADLRWRRIPNWLVLLGIVVALAGGWSGRGWPGGSVTSATLGMMVAGLSLLPLYVVGGMGAGDVKLMTMVGAWLGPGGAVSAVLLTLVTGGVLALAAVLWSGRAHSALRNVRVMLLGTMARVAGWRPVVAAPIRSVGKVPYAIAIVAGTLLHLVMAGRGVSIIG